MYSILPLNAQSCLTDFQKYRPGRNLSLIGKDVSKYTFEKAAA